MLVILFQRQELATYGALFGCWLWRWSVSIVGGPVATAGGPVSPSGSWIDIKRYSSRNRLKVAAGSWAVSAAPGVTAVADVGAGALWRLCKAIGKAAGNTSELLLWLWRGDVSENCGTGSCGFCSVFA